MCKKLWPELELTEEGGELDCQGIDGFLNGEALQVKSDDRIATSGNIYHELYEKTPGREHLPWRPSPHKATLYAFVTLNEVFLVSLDSLARLEIGLRLIKIKPTSIGFLLPSGVVRQEAITVEQLKSQQIFW